MNDLAPSTQDVFGSEQSVLNALVTIRNSTLSPDDKALLRNLFLDYISADDAKKTDLKDVIGTHLSRLSNALPNLITTSISQNNTAKPPTNTQLTKPNLQGRNKPVFGAKENNSTAETQPISESVPIQTIPPTPTPSAPINQDHKTRITQIKHDINSAAGNPVNLVDADEAVGREYMSSLLEAIKLSSIGGPAADEALARLEKAYQAAKEVIRNNPNIGKEKPPAPKPEPKPEPTPVTPQISKSEVSTGLYHKPIDEQVIETKEEKPSSVAAKAGHLWQKPKPTPKIPEPTKPAGPVAIPSYGTEIRQVNVAPNEPKEKPTVQPAQTPQPAAAPKTTVLKPLSATTSLPQKISELEKNAAKQAEKEQQPIEKLEDPTITEGLKQLLTEWSLFKSSGFLGTGPNGIDHPLYKRLAKLPMASVIAGRFEGATPEVKDGLTAYMNGWRFEHGIVHDMGESFEHYLRRVIKLIIDKQRTSPLGK